MSQDQNLGLSVYDQMRKNRWRTGYLLMTFPIIVLGLTYLGIVLAILFSDAGQNPLLIANELMKTFGFWVIIGVFAWSTISYFIGSSMIMAFAGAKPIEKKDNPLLYRAVENVSIAAGLAKTPDIYIINDTSLNAFATGRNPKSAKVAISQGLLEKLDKAELESVIAHEVGHIINRDIRVMLISVAVIGAIQMIGEIFIRIRSRGSDKKNGTIVFIIIGLLFITIGVILGTLTRLALSREREYLADSTSANLTSNPNALASALEKIAADARVEILDKKASIGALCIADPTESGHLFHKKVLGSQVMNEEPKTLGFWRKIWSSHPPISDRINRLRHF